MGFQVNDSGPYKAFEYWWPLRALNIAWLQIKGGIIHADYSAFGRNIEVDVVDLGKRAMTRFSVSTLYFRHSNGLLIGRLK